MSLSNRVTKDHAHFVLMIICLHVYMGCMSVFDKVLKDRDCFMLMFICIYMCVCHFMKGDRGSFLWRSDFLCR